MIVATKQVPFRCIWCLKESPDVTFISESHVLPECVGNERQQVLPKGVVCDKCNHYFGSKIEPTLINDPIFKTTVGILQLRDKAKEFVYKHSPSGVHRDAHMDVVITGNSISVTTKYEIQGQSDKPYENRNIMPKQKTYDKKSLKLFSRAVHKIAYESLAGGCYFKIGVIRENPEINNLDIFDPKFDPIRKWVRYGEPSNQIRQVLRLFCFGEAKNQIELFRWRFGIYKYRTWLRFEMNLYGDCYALSLTSPNTQVQADLINFVENTTSNYPISILADKIKQLK